MFALARVLGLSASALITAGCSSSALPDFATGGPDERHDASATHEAGAKPDPTFAEDAGPDRDGATPEDARVGDVEPGDAGTVDAGVSGAGGPLTARECSACAVVLHPAGEGTCADDEGQPVEWTCTGFEPEVYARLADHCTDQATGITRYCCPEAFAPECPRD